MSIRKQDFLALFAGFFCAIILFFLGVVLALPKTTVIVFGTSVQHVQLGGLDADQARKKLLERLVIPEQTTIAFSVSSTTSAVITPTHQLGLSYNVEQAVRDAQMVGRTGSIMTRIKQVLGATISGINLPAFFQWDEAKVDTYIADLSSQYNQDGKVPSIELRTTGVSSSIKIDPGKYGQIIDKSALRANILDMRSSIPTKPIVVPMTVIQPLSPDAQETALERARLFVGTMIQTKIAQHTKSVTDQELIALFALPAGFSDEKITQKIAEWAQQTDQLPKEPVLIIENNKVVQFDPPEDGLQLEKTQAAEQMKSSLQMLEEKLRSKNHDPFFIELPVAKTAPQKSLESLNDRGIKEKIGVGESTFFHSIPSRVHNVTITMQRLNNTLVAPGATFSFNKSIGEVSKETGYQPAYIIQQGRTVLGDGGGVCQVSTTTYRAAMNAGMPITRRKGHSYRVGYYEQNTKPGFDATVIAPSQDFQFKNDTKDWILIRTIVDPKNYYARIEFWGTGDGRTAEITEYKQWGATGPKPTVYIDDPSLPPGRLKQIDWSAPGLKVSYRYTVKKKNDAGEEVVIQDETFLTVYQPWAAVYLRGI